MQIRSTDPSRSRSLEDLEQAAPTRSVENAAPDWERIPTLDDAALSAVQGGSEDAKGFVLKLQKLRTDVKELHDALAPYGRECKEVMHGAHELQEAVEMIHHAKDFGPLAPEIIALALAKAAHGAHAVASGIAGMRREAPEAVRKAEPALAKVVQDIDDLKASLLPSIDRPVTVRG